MTYRGWTIRYDPPPIPIRSFDWQAFGPNYDASWEGEEDGYVDNGQKVAAASREKLIEEIDAWIEEHPPSWDEFFARPPIEIDAETPAAPPQANNQ